MFPDRVSEVRPDNWFSTGEESGMSVPAPSLHDLLDKSLESLRGNLREKGNTPELVELRKLHGRRLRSWWGSKRLAYLSAKSAATENNPWVRIGEDEEVQMSQMEEYITDDPILTINHRNSHEDNSITLAAFDGDTLDIFRNPPKITRSYKETPDSLPQYYWEVVMRGSAITTINKTTVHEPASLSDSEVKEIEGFDASVFGIDRVGMMEHFGIIDS